MKFSYSRTLAMLALALGLSSCGSKAEFDIEVRVAGVKYDSLVIVDKRSSATMTITADKNKDDAIFIGTFPRGLEYGDEYQLEVGTAPPHQTCVGGATDTAGRLSDIVIGFNCTLVKKNVLGTITFPTTVKPTGLTIINGDDHLFTAIDTSIAYTFTAITYNDSFTLAISNQPTDGKSICKFVPKVPASGTLQPNGFGFNGVMGDDDVVVDVTCTAV